jgi:TonB-dependent receptor
MRSFVTRAARCAALVSASALVVLAAAPHKLLAQGSGNIAGRVADSAGHGLPAAVTIVGNTRYGAYAGPDGSYVLTDVPAGSYRLAAHFIGFKGDTVQVTVTSGQTVTAHLALIPVATTLNSVVVTSPRLNETQAGALQEQKDADNILTVMSGDEMRQLPNYNVAEALARMPGVTSERDEGEGKFVEIRGLPPQFQHVMIDGADVPGTLNGDRSVKLDDVPADVLGAIEVNKTLSADMDAGAIGGSVNLVTKVPEGAPRGYASGYYGYQTLESNNNGHGDVSYGGRVGSGSRFGFLFDGSIDRTDRVINDVEPSWQAVAPNGQGGYYNVNNGAAYSTAWPSWSEREYNYYRTRYGLGGNLDYRFSPTSSLYLKGLWSAFFDEANRWVTGIGGDSLVNIGGQPTVAGASASPFYSNRGPIEHTWGLTGGGKHNLGAIQFSYAANYAGSTANQHNHYDDSYSPTSSPFDYTYNASHLIPRAFFDQPTLAGIHNPNAYQLTQLSTDNELTNGYIVGAHADALLPYAIGTLPAAFKFGVKIENQHKGYLSNQPAYTPNNTLTLSQFPSNYSAPSFYSSVCAGCYPLAPFGSLPAVNQNLVNSPNSWTFVPNGLSDTLATYAGTEQVNAVYGMQTLDVSDLHINIGLRVENTNIGYVGHGEDTTGALLANPIHGSHSYTDLFPSLQLKYSLGENTNLRAAITRGIARPNYSDLAPHFSAVGAIANSPTAGVSAGNPNLKPEYAWNYDLLAEHYFSSVGVLSGGLFYKDIRDFIFNRIGLYPGPVRGYSNYYASLPENGPSATLWGFEFDYTQHLTFLPGLLQGIGFDVNWTHVESRAIVPQDTTVSYTNLSTGQTVSPYAGQPFRHAPIPRQFPNLYNASLLYDYGPVKGRLSGQYTSASIYGYGSDGTSNPTSGDNWNYAHFQLDASLSYTVFRNDAITLQALNLTNSVFGFFNGTTRTQWNVQREYYGTTIFIGYRKGF